MLKEIEERQSIRKYLNRPVEHEKNHRAVKSSHECP